MEIMRKIAIKYMEKQYKNAIKSLIRALNDKENENKDDYIEVLCNRVKDSTRAYAQAAHRTHTKKGAYIENGITHLNVETKKKIFIPDYEMFLIEAEEAINRILNTYRPNYLEDPYYADLFVINGKGCLVTGHGKSKTCRNYTGESTKEICTDCIRLNIEEDCLVGYGDPAMGMCPIDFENTQSTHIQYLLYMQTADDTTDKFIKEITKEEFCKAAAFNITYAANNPNERQQRFKALLDRADVTCITVPWCDNMEEKGLLIKEYIK